MGSVLGGGEGVGGVRLIAIVRTNGERTKDLAAKLVSEQVETEVIAVRPFTGPEPVAEAIFEEAPV